jgi:hypothetical protein
MKIKVYNKIVDRDSFVTSKEDSCRELVTSSIFHSSIIRIKEEPVFVFDLNVSPPEQYCKYITENWKNVESYLLDTGKFAIKGRIHPHLLSLLLCIGRDFGKWNDLFPDNVPQIIENISKRTNKGRQATVSSYYCFGTSIYFLSVFDFCYEPFIYWPKNRDGTGPDSYVKNHWKKHSINIAKILLKYGDIIRNDSDDTDLTSFISGVKAVPALEEVLKCQ